MPYMYSCPRQGCVVTGTRPFESWKLWTICTSIDLLFILLSIGIMVEYGFSLIMIVSLCVNICGATLHVSTKNMVWFADNWNTSFLFIINICKLVVAVGLIGWHSYTFKDNATKITYSIFVLFGHVFTSGLTFRNYGIYKKQEKDQRKREEQEMAAIEI